MVHRSAMSSLALALGLSFAAAACAWPPRGGPSPTDEPQAAAEQPGGVFEQTAVTAEQTVAEVVGGAGQAVRPATKVAAPRRVAPRMSAPVMRAPAIGSGSLLRR